MTNEQIIKEIKNRIRELTKLCNKTNNRHEADELYGMIIAYKECLEMLNE